MKISLDGLQGIWENGKVDRAFYRVRLLVSDSRDIHDTKMGNQISSGSIGNILVNLSMRISCAWYLSEHWAITLLLTAALAWVPWNIKATIHQLQCPLLPYRDVFQV